ncbi:hypothetical protein [Bradyrhizobium sp. Ash2021]|uniref:hypothetical protein n=1 Tax=Bradyrhizobium sp. Ash2021 TaxID=2954771 RepID=UPI002815992B|nr:hypothetical protein [Bradyrhizobium sp. Ash2021]WMT73536.1 hypothetical protein NL528_37240 [Bradyrhizobium sp. Ash2021]
MSFQITVLKVLAGHPEGRASVADLTRYVAVLSCSGADWSERMKRLAARAPGLDIFSSGYVLREDSGWLITDVGRRFLASIETPVMEARLEPVFDASAAPVAVGPHTNVIHLSEHEFTRRRRAAQNATEEQIGETAWRQVP